MAAAGGPRGRFALPPGSGPGWLLSLSALLSVAARGALATTHWVVTEDGKIQQQVAARAYPLRPPASAPGKGDAQVGLRAAPPRPAAAPSPPAAGRRGDRLCPGFGERSWVIPAAVGRGPGPPRAGAAGGGPGAVTAWAPEAPAASPTCRSPSGHRRDPGRPGSAGSAPCTRRGLRTWPPGGRALPWRRVCPDGRTAPRTAGFPYINFDCPHFFLFICFYLFHFLVCLFVLERCCCLHSARVRSATESRDPKDAQRLRAKPGKSSGLSGSGASDSCVPPRGGWGSGSSPGSEGVLLRARSGQGRLLHGLRFACSSAS